MRLFYALFPPADLRIDIAETVERHRGDLKGRWVHPANLHITLAFLGEQPTQRLAEIEAAGVEAARGIAPFDLVWGGLGAFNSLRRARVAFLEVVVGEDALAGLASRLAAALPEHLRPDRRPFRGHLTLARFKLPPPEARLRELASALAEQRWSLQATQMTLMESHLESSGARYVERARFPLE